ncbi:MAG: right-handed parallel beta-helix repeat-containing protein [Proteobacteria bacterium]|nr:right-handed parallel beta-helix repeat-containing protein [Pseudomonadota bacterium]
MNTKGFISLIVVAAIAAAGGYLYAQRAAVPVAATAARSAAAELSSARSPAAAGAPASLTAGGTGQVIAVKPGDSIQAAVARAQPGDTVQVLPGTYRETVYIDKDNVALIGVVHGGDWPTLDGEGKRNDAVLYSGNGIRVENLHIVNFKGNAIMGQAGNNFVIRHNWIANAGVYGIFPEFAQNGLIEYNTLTGIEDAAIYVGMSDNIHVAHNEVFGNVAGIEIENSRHAIVEHNLAYDNAGGILAFITPGLPIKTTFDVIIRNNFVVANNHRNFGAPGSIVSGIPSGTGIIIMAADDVFIENNVVRDNKNAGIIVADHKSFANITPDPESDPNPDRVSVLWNLFAHNGYEPIKEIKVLMAAALTTEGPDLVAVGGGSGSCVADKSALKSLGIGSWASGCARATTADVSTYLLEHPAKARVMNTEDRGKLIYSSVCAGCHAYNVRMIGPPTQVIQAMYAGNPQGIADYIANPVKKREDFPAMPPQGHLSPDLRLAVAKYMLAVTQGKPRAAATP